MKFAVAQFPGSNGDQDCVYTVRHCGHQAEYRWHMDASLGDVDAVLVPGGFSYGDYLRTGAIARFSPVMQAVREFADSGGWVLGICNGFQILCEAGLLPGALIRNRSLQFRSEPVFLKTANHNTAFTNKIPTDKVLCIPIAHGEGCYYADPETIDRLKANRQILWQYSNEQGELTDDANPNGSLENIAGICNERGNVAGLMPHPERACEEIMGGLADGKLVFDSLIAAWEERHKVATAP